MDVVGPLEPAARPAGGEAGVGPIGGLGPAPAQPGWLPRGDAGPVPEPGGVPRGELSDGRVTFVPVLGEAR